MLESRDRVVDRGGGHLRRRCAHCSAGRRPGSAILVLWRVVKRLDRVLHHGVVPELRVSVKALDCATISFWCNAMAPVRGRGPAAGRGREGGCLCDKASVAVFHGLCQRSRPSRTVASALSRAAGNRLTKYRCLTNEVCLCVPTRCWSTAVDGYAKSRDHGGGVHYTSRTACGPAAGQRLFSIVAKSLGTTVACDTCASPRVRPTMPMPAWQCPSNGRHGVARVSTRGCCATWHVHMLP